MPLLIACAPAAMACHARRWSALSADSHDDRRRKRGHARGYDNAHRRRRAALLPSAIGSLCSIRGQIMRADEVLDLHHSLPLVIAPNSVGDVIVHAVCNRGGRRPGPVFGNDP
jgi:hypothetical protein